MTHLPSLERLTPATAALALAEFAVLEENATMTLERPLSSEASTVADPMAAADESVDSGTTTPPELVVPVTVVNTGLPLVSVVGKVVVTIGGKGN